MNFLSKDGIWDQGPICGSTCIEMISGMKKFNYYHLLRSADCGAGVRGLISMRDERHSGPRVYGFCDCTSWARSCSTSHPESPKLGKWAVPRCVDRWCACRCACQGRNLQGCVIPRTTHCIGNPATEPIISVTNAKEFYGRKRTDLYNDCGVARADRSFALIKASSGWSRRRAPTRALARRSFEAFAGFHDLRSSDREARRRCPPL
jgi:hypothetical protein